MLMGELLFVNGRFFTGLGGPECEALAIRDGLVTAVGRAEELRERVAPSAPVVDLGGRRVVPGLIDSHIHAIRAGTTWSERLDWSGVRRISTALGMVHEAAAHRPGQWVAVVGGWHPGQFDERRAPTPAELTEAAPDNPVYVQLLYESAILNAAGLAAAGIDRDSADPPNSVFARDRAGTPTGHASGRGAFAHVLGLMAEPDLEASVAGTRAFLRRLSSLGLTGVVDPGGGAVDARTYRAVYELWRREPLPVRVRLYMSNSSTPRGQELARAREFVRYLHPGFGDEYLRFVGMGEKLVNAFGDGEGLSAITVRDEDRHALRDVSMLLLEHGWPAHIHAIRRETVSAVLDVWEQVAETTPLDGARFSLAHADAISARDLERVRRLGVGIAVQDRLVFRSADSTTAWGEEIGTAAPPLRTMLDLGIPVGGGTDATAVTSYNPWLSMWWMVTGKSVDGAPPRTAHQRLTRAEALHLYTAGSAWFSFDERKRGSLAAGTLADLAVLAADYLQVPDDAIPAIESELTLVGGRVVHRAVSFAGAFPDEAGAAPRVAVVS
jgi:predicted amidohydrolase YtcJ